jgi:hypothetical protein
VLVDVALSLIDGGKALSDLALIRQLATDSILTHQGVG